MPHLLVAVAHPLYLEELAVARGPGSVEANALDELRRERAQDKRVFACRLGKFIGAQTPALFAVKLLPLTRSGGALSARRST